MVAGDDPLGWIGGTVDERVTIERLVGQGGFGYVYRGTHLGFREPVAVKFLRLAAQLEESERESFLRDFREEARLLHRLSRRTAGIVQALDVGAAVSPKGIWTPYIVMEWLEGHSLEDDLVLRTRQGLPPRSPGAAIALLAPVAQALAVGHASGIAHLDVKPANLFLARQEGEATLKVLDYGIARALTSSTVTRGLTARGTGVAAFTPAYAAPEQFSPRHGKVGPHTDVFALALILIEVASGRAALEGETPLQLYVSAANEHLRPSLASSGVEADEALEAILRHALAVDPAHRLPDAAAFWGALGAVAGAHEAASVRVHVSVMPGSVPVSEARTALAGGATALPAALRASGRNRVCTVLVAELVGTATLAHQLDPDEFGEVVDRALGAVAAAVEEAGGEVEELAGERVVAAFGLHSDSAGAATRAVHAALHMRRTIVELALPRQAQSAARPRLRVGIDTGRVFVRGGDTKATGRRLGFAGEPVTVAARLAQAAGSNAIVVGRDTYRQVAGLFDAEAFELPIVEGDRQERPEKAYRVTDVARAAAARGIVAEVEFQGVATRFVGRGADMEAVERVADDVTSAPGARLAVVTGPGGVGRSRFLHELAQRLEARGFLVLATHASALQTRTSYALAASVVRGQFHVHDDDARELARQKVERGIRELARVPAGGDPVPSGRARNLTQPSARGSRVRALEPTEIAEQLLPVLGFSPPRPSDGLTADEASASIKHRVAAAFAALVATIRRPVAILCDDAHWADEASLELIDDLLVRLADRSIIAVCSGPPQLLERRPAWGAAGRARELIELPPLSPRQLEEMVRDRLARARNLPDELVRDLADRAEGYPLALAETLHLLIDNGAIDTRPTGTPGSTEWELHPERVELAALPTTVAGIVQARLDRLDMLSQQLLCKAAVIGRTFWDGALAKLSAMDGASINLMLADLCTRGLLRRRPPTTFPDEQEYSFAESAIQEVAYQILPQRARRELHRELAEWLEARTASDATAALVARHYEKAAALDRAVRAYARAGAHAASLGQTAEACECYEAACRIDAWMTGETDVSGPTDEAYAAWQQPADKRVLEWPERTRLRVELGEVLRHTGDLEQARRRYEDARGCIVRTERRAETAVDPADVARWDARIDFRLARIEYFAGATAVARELVERAIERARVGDLVEEQAQMHALLASLHSLREGDTRTGIEVALRGLRVCRGASRRKERWRETVAWLLRALGVALHRRGRLVRAERCYLQAARLLDERAHAHELAPIILNVGATRYARGDLVAARDAFRRSLDLADRSGDLLRTMLALGNLGEVEHKLGRNEAARDLLVEATGLGERMGARAELTECYRNLAETLADLGDAAGSIDAALRALELGREGGGAAYLPSVAETLVAICTRFSQGDHAARARDLAGELRGVLDGALAANEGAARWRDRLALLLGR